MAAARDENGSRRRRASKWDTPAPNTGSATEAAHETARKLNAMLAAKGKLTTNSTPPLLPPKPLSTTGTSGSDSTSMFTEEIEINNSPKRLLLLQDNVQYEIHKYSGATISTRGKYIEGYIAPLEKGEIVKKPLYLHIQAPSRDKLNLAVQRIRGIMQGDNPFTASTPIIPQQSCQTSTLPSGMYYVQEKVFVGLDNVQPEFNLREKIVGPGECYFQHITKATGAKVHLRGRGSGFIEATSGREAFEALYVYISHPNYPGLGAAKKLVENLIQTVHSAYQAFQMQQTSNSYYTNYGGYPGQNTGAPPHRPLNMYNMPPMSGYGPPPHSNGPPPSYPSYQYPLPNRPPLQYNQHVQPGPNHNIPPNPQMPPPHALYPRPLMNEQGPPPDEPRPLMEQPTSPYIPEYPIRPHQAPPSPQFNYNSPPVSENRISYNEVESKKTEEESPEPPMPAKRRFTEAPAKTPDRPAVPESVIIEKRSVSSLDQQSTQARAPGGGDVHKGSNMAPPVLNIKKESVSSSGCFKMPLMPVSAVLSGSTKNVLAPPSKAAGKKRKLEEAEKKSTGFALLGSYDDSSDED